MQNKAIGIFDSGIGGLTVLKELRKQLPNEQLVYFGDTARIPYGTKSRELVQQYALEDAAFLLQYDVKMIVVACNTASAMAIEILKKRLHIPVVGVVIPGAKGAIRDTVNKKIGVIGTSATVNSNAYTRAIEQFASENMEVFSKACPLLVPLVEEGWLHERVTCLTLEKYLQDILVKEIDTLILGCTHYPLLHNTIQEVTGQNVKLIDSGSETAKFVRQVLEDEDLLKIKDESYSEMLRDFIDEIVQVKDSDKIEIGSWFLGEPLTNVQRIDFDKFLVSHFRQLQKMVFKQD